MMSTCIINIANSAPRNGWSGSRRIMSKKEPKVSALRMPSIWIVRPADISKDGQKFLAFRDRATRHGPLLPADYCQRGLLFTSSGGRTELVWKHDIRLGCKGLRLNAKDADQIDYCQLGGRSAMNQGLPIF